jgi:predicted transposase YbfD/YdcC
MYVIFCDIFSFIASAISLGEVILVFKEKANDLCVEDSIKKINAAGSFLLSFTQKSEESEVFEAYFQLHGLNNRFW